MYKALIFVFAIIALGNAVEVSDEDVRVCFDHLVSKLRALNGGFITQQQGIDVSYRVSQQYLNGMSLEQIAQGLQQSIQEILLPDQARIFADVYNTSVAILGDREEAKQLYKKAMQISMDFIASDKQTIDDEILSLRSQGASDNEIKRRVCQILYGMITIEKKQALIRELDALIPADKLDAIRAQLSRIINLY